jgi:uncharacterized protein (DUF433 family)
MTLEQLQSELLALSPQEKAQMIQLLVSSLSDTWVGIEKTPGVMGGDACIRQTRIPVWLLVSLRQQGATDAFILEDYPNSRHLTWRMPGSMPAPMRTKLKLLYSGKRRFTLN